MTPKLKRKWIKALRSGKYKQGKKKLFHAGRYCCLGVLAREAGLELTQSTHHIDFESLCGLGAQSSELIDMNDGGVSFSEIADWLEEHV